MERLRFPHQDLGGDVVVLRCWKRDDIPALVSGLSDPEVDRFFWPRADPYTEADAREFVESQEARLTAGDVHFAVVEPRRSDTVRGGVLLRGVDFVDRRAVLGYWIEPRARGRGLATHAVRLLARWAFDELALARLELTSAPDNDASSRVAERCGFLRQGLLRSYVEHKGHRADRLMFSLLPGNLSEEP